MNASVLSFSFFENELNLPNSWFAIPLTGGDLYLPLCLFLISLASNLTIFASMTMSNSLIQ